MGGEGLGKKYGQHKKARHTATWCMGAVLLITGNSNGILTWLISCCCLRDALTTQSSMTSIYGVPELHGLNFSRSALDFSVRPRKPWIVLHWAYCCKPAKWNFKNVGVVYSAWTLKISITIFKDLFLLWYFKNSYRNFVEHGTPNVSQLSFRIILRIAATASQHTHIILSYFSPKIYQFLRSLYFPPGMESTIP